MNPPSFDSDELRVELNRIFSVPKNQQRRLVALFGRADTPSVGTDLGEFLVRSVDSELALRRTLPPPTDDAPRMVVLLGWQQTEIPNDLSWRFVGNGKVYRVGKADQLRQRFGGPGSLAGIDPDFARSRLASFLLSYPVDASLRTSVGRITRDVAYETWIRALWRVAPDSSLGLDTLLAWAATNGREAHFNAMMLAPEAEGVREELYTFLRSRVSEAAPLVWELWAQGKGRLALEFGLLFEALIASNGNGPMSAVRTASKHALGLAGEAFESTWRPLGQAVDRAIRELERTGHATLVKQSLNAAEAHLDVSEHAQLLASDRLPVAWSARLAAFGRTLLDAADRPTADTVVRAHGGVLDLDRHAHAAQPDHHREVERAEMATRLLAWLVARTDENLAKGRTSWADAGALASWYAQEGGYVDWARHHSRGSTESMFGRGIERILAKVDAIRVQQDRTFAAGLVAWLEENRPPQVLTPIDQALDAFAVPYLERNPEHRLLVLLIDGMAWAQALSILESLDAGANPWAPAAWNTDVKQGGPLFRPVLASLPSVTSISRSAFFAGQPMFSGKQHSASDNPKHWSSHSRITKFRGQRTGPTLMLRGDGFNIDGSPATSALNLVADTSERIVALVVNSIDETLKADTQAFGSWTADAVGPLRELLQAAASAGRAVLIASDHGHVSGQRLEWTGFNSGAGSSRWRPWRESDAVHEYEVAIPHQLAWTPKLDGAKGIICLADDAHSYSTQTHYGEHGGATLAEVLAPTFMIACENLQSHHAPDPALELQRVRAPDWWHLELSGDVRRKPTAPKKPTAKVREHHDREEAGQLVIPTAVPEPAAPSAASIADAYVSAATLQMLDKLEKNPVFLARAEHPKRREEVLRALRFLLERNSRASTALFAAALGQPAFRINGFVASLSEILNVDGYDVLTIDQAGKQVVLHAEQLRVGFGL